MVSMLETERIAVRYLRMEEFGSNLKSRLHAIMLKEPRDVTDIAAGVGVSRDMIQSFITGARKPYYKSLCKLEIWIRKEEERLGIS
jgi:hypothetical protein